MDLHFPLTNLSDLRPFKFQVAGHGNTDAPQVFLDSIGRLVKVQSSNDRSRREKAFYECISHVRGVQLKCISSQGACLGSAVASPPSCEQSSDLSSEKMKEDVSHRVGCSTQSQLHGATCKGGPQGLDEVETACTEVSTSVGKTEQRPVLRISDEVARQSKPVSSQVPCSFKSASAEAGLAGGKDANDIDVHPASSNGTASLENLQLLSRQPLNDAVTRTALDELVALEPFIPQVYGVVLTEDHMQLYLENLCASYAQPSVLDVKIGFRTDYAWADDAYNAKNRRKDAESTQASLGFKVSGMHVQRTDGVRAVDKKACKLAGVQDIRGLLASFSQNGRGLKPNDVWDAILPRLDKLKMAISGGNGWWHLFSVSLLIIYEGSASNAGEARSSCHLIDFAHCFIVHDSRDENFVAGLTSFMTVIKDVCQEGKPG